MYQKKTGTIAQYKIKKLRSPFKFFSLKLERKHKPVSHSVNDAVNNNSESERLHLENNRVKKQLSPIIEALLYIDQEPFHFGLKKNKRNVEKVMEYIERKDRIEEMNIKKPISRRENKGIDIYLTNWRWMRKIKKRRKKRRKRKRQLLY